jgi:hypothetical protein
VKKTELKRKVALTANPDATRAFVQRGQRNSKPKRTPISACTPAQRERVEGTGCLVCGERPVDPAHLIPRAMCPSVADDPRIVVGLCRSHHRDYDQGRLSLLEYLEPTHREELGFAVWAFGLISTLERVTNERWRPLEEAA